MGTSLVSIAQTLIEGNIKSGEESIPFAHIYLKGSTFGTTSNVDGYFKLEIPAEQTILKDSLVVSYLGYLSKDVPFTKNISQTIEVELKAEFFMLEELVVRPGPNPAFPILDKAIENRSLNNPESYDSYYFEEYSKTRFDLNHFTEKLKENFLLRPFDHIWDHVDTTNEGVNYLPVLLIEELTDHYYQKSPKEKKDIVQGINFAGLKGPKMMQFASDLTLTPNVYDDYIVILDKNFPSPINKNYKSHHLYYLHDSLMIDGEEHYKITFKPKQKGNLAFRGQMFIHKESFAVQQMDLRFDISANVNFVRSYFLSQRYKKIEGQKWMPSEMRIIGDFTVIENSAEMSGFFARKNAKYRKHKIDEKIAAKTFAGIADQIESDSARYKNEIFWLSARDSSLNKEDQGVFEMMYKLENDPKFIFRKNLVTALTTGYIPIKNKIDIGDIYTFYSHNFIEKSRLKFGFRTNQNLKKPFNASSFVAYGTHDEKWKYGGSLDYSLGKKTSKQSNFGLSYNNDLIQIGKSSNTLPIDHILTSFIQVGNTPSRVYSEDLRAWFQQRMGTGIVGRIHYFRQNLQPVLGQKFLGISDTDEIIDFQNYKAEGIGFTFKFNWQNKSPDALFYDKKDNKTSFRKYPDLALHWEWADEEIFNSDFDFHKIKISLQQQVRSRNLGYFMYRLEGGKTIGTVPFPFLDIPFGNQLILYDEFAFNLMNFLEYATDQYLNIQVQHHFDGAILNKIPFNRKLKWRSLIFARAFIGSIENSNNQEKYLFPAGLQALENPYVEVGFGFENIFKLGRMDFVWRLTDRDKPGHYNFIVKPSFKFGF